ncbi:MAG TPA: ATP-binding protein [Actinomycetota bacterium]|nr:ATP-binding protein [Actinomycetota bacterium]
MEFGEPTKRVLRLTANPASASAARRWLASLDVPLNDERAEQLRFLANELVTNSIRHAAGKSVCVEVEVLPGSIRVSIIDDGDGGAKPTLQHPSIWNTGGRGLALVDRLSSRWGHSTADGTVVWFEIDREDAFHRGRLIER